MSFSWLKSTLSSYVYRDQSHDDTLQLTKDDLLTIDDPSNSSSTSNTSTTTTTTTTTSIQSSVQGLENLGNTCFFNASVQALLACPKFVEYIKILSKSHKHNTSHSEYTPYEPLPKSKQKTNNSSENKIFCELLFDLYFGRITSPEHLFNQLCAFHPTEFSSFTQSDAHESFNKMMEILEIEQLYIATESQSENIINNMFDFLENAEEFEYKTEYKTNNELDICNIKNPFDGLLGNMVECIECKYSNESKQTSFKCLTLSLTDDLNQMNNGFDSILSVHLMDRINAFEKQEEIDGYKCIICEYNGIVNIIKQKLNDFKNENKYKNEIEINVLNEQYYELNEKLNKLLINKTNNNNGYIGINGLNDNNGKILNGYNGYLYTENNHINGNNNNNNKCITNKQRIKYRIDIGLNKEFRVKANKKQFVSRYPNVLCIHLNRLQFGAKDNRYVSFKPLLNLNNNNIKEINYNNVMFNDNDYILLSQYILMSVIVHHGSDLGGHYTTYKRKINIKNINKYNNNNNNNGLEWKSLDELKLIERNSKWYHISDQFVKLVTINDVLTCKAYMLFYQKNQFSFLK